MLLFQLSQDISADALTARLRAAESYLTLVHTLEVDAPVTEAFLDLHDEDLQGVEDDQGSHWKGIRLKEVEVVMEATGVEGWEDEVARLEQCEAKAIVESPSRMCEQVSDDLRQPEESEDRDAVDVFGHNTWIEDHQGEGDERNVDPEVRLPHFTLLSGCSSISD